MLIYSVVRNSLSLLIALVLAHAPAYAEDVLRIVPPESTADHRLEYTDSLLMEAMHRTTAKYGPFRVERAPAFLSRERLLAEIIRGDSINVTSVPSQPAWEKQLTTIWIPVDLGIADYRISLIRRDHQKILSAVKTLEDLKTLSMGAGTQWSSRKIYEDNGFNVVPGYDYEALFRMLINGRFEHFPRGVNEVFTEYADRKDAFPELAIEQDLVVQFPLPRYFFVTKKEPRLAQRIEEGLESMVSDGTMMRMMREYHADMIRQANFCARRVFRIPNTQLSPKAPLNRKEFWFDPYDPEAGICIKAPSTGRATKKR